MLPHGGAAAVAAKVVELVRVGAQVPELLVSTPSNLTDPQRLNDLLLFRLSRISSAAGVAVVRLCEGGHGTTRREWRLLAQLADAGGPLTPMPHPLRRAALALTTVGLTLLSACSTDQFWNIGQAWQRDHCMKLQDHQDRSRCLGDRSRSRDDYERQAEGLRPYWHGRVTRLVYVFGD